MGVGSAGSQKVTPVIGIFLTLVLIAFVAWRGWVAFAPIQAGPLPPEPTAEINFIAQKAKDCQGDFTKLSADDQAKVNQISRGFGPANIAAAWRKANKQ